MINPVACCLRSSVFLHSSPIFNFYNNRVLHDCHITSVNLFNVTIYTPSSCRSLQPSQLIFYESELSISHAYRRAVEFGFDVDQALLA